MVVLLVVHGVVDARDRHSVVDASLVDARGQRVLWHVEIGGQDQGLGGLVVFLAGVSKKLPDFLLAARSSFPKFFSPFLEGVLRKRSFVCRRLFDPLTCCLIL